MPERVRFHLDEHMDPDIALALRRHGVDVTTTVEPGLRTREDERHLDFGRAENRVIVTDNTDFLRLAAETPDHPGVVFCRRTQHSLGDLIRFLLLVHEVHGRGDGGTRGVSVSASPHGGHPVHAVLAGTDSAAPAAK